MAYLSMRLRLRPSLPALLLAFAVLPASADAHAFLLSSTPASGVSLNRAPRVVTLRFTEPVSPALTRVQLFDGRGTQRDGARISAGRTGSELRVSLPQLATGAYRIAFATVSQTDLHATRGGIVFGAGTAAPPAQASDSPATGTSITESVAHLFDLISLSLLIAICALLAGGVSAAVRFRVERFALVALPAALLGGVVALANKSSQVPLREALANTAWGHAMLVRELAIVAVLVALATRRRRLALALLVPVAAAEAASGHAASLDALAILTMTAHILAGCLWVGGLIVLALVLPGLERRDVLETLARFGRLAAASVAVVVATGLYSAGRQVANLDALLATTYGWSLLAKLACLAATGAFGLLGLVAVRRLRPSLRLLQAEAFAAIGVLVTASLLLSTSPARGPQFAASSRPIVGTALASGHADDLLVDISAAPNRPGQNFVTATILDTLRPPPAQVGRVTLTFSRGARRVTMPAKRLDASRWQVAGTQLSASGAWRVAVAVERKGLQRATYATDWTVSSPPLPPGTYRPRYSQRPLQSIMSDLAIVLAALVACAGLWRWRTRIGMWRTRTA
ncbi:MAG: copper transport protein [Gaiellales bacterium]|jgi:copper transport protein|nr:copper transport protein [Gaiellales bacterium]